MRILLCLLLWLLPLTVRAAAPRGEPAAADLCRPAVAAAEQHARLPRGVLLAIAQVESGRPDPRSGRLDPWPWTIDAEGEGQFFATKAQAIAAVRDLQARGVRSIDVGCMQVNLQFHPAAFRNLEQAFDPDANAAYAASFLNRLHGDSDDWMQAIAAYHSSTQVIGADYRRRVLALWRKPDLPGWSIGLATAYRDFLPHRAIYADFPSPSEVYGAFPPAGGVRK